MAFLPDPRQIARGRDDDEWLLQLSLWGSGYAAPSPRHKAILPACDSDGQNEGGTGTLTRHLVLLPSWRMI